MWRGSAPPRGQITAISADITTVHGKRDQAFKLYVSWRVEDKDGTMVIINLGVLLEGKNQF